MANGKTWRDNHVIISLTMIALVAGSITAIGTISGAYDAGHTSQAELDIVIRQQSEASLQAKCEALAIRISLTENTIWQLEQAGQTSQRLVEKRRELRELEARYTELHCSSVLSV